MSIKFSIIVITCNRDPAILKECLDSVFTQTYTNYEVIVVNDGPSYEKKEEIDKLINSYNGVIYVTNKENMGANYSRNLGASVSSGQILSFLDDDDIWDKKRLEIISNSVDANLCVFYSDFISFSGKKTKYHKRIYPSNYPESIEKMLEFNYLGGFSNVSFSKDIFTDSGMLDERMESYQDQDLFIRLLTKKPKIVYHPHPLSYYRISPVSISLNSERKLNGLLRFLEKYSSLYSTFRDSLVIRLKNELVYSEKQGWKHNSTVISDILKKYVSPMSLFKIRMKGRIKRFASFFLK